MEITADVRCPLCGGELEERKSAGYSYLLCASCNKGMVPAGIRLMVVELNDIKKGAPCPTCNEHCEEKDTFCRHCGTTFLDDDIAALPHPRHRGKHND